MKKIHAIIVDDEASARENLEILIQRFCPNIEVKANFNLLKKAVDYLSQNPIDVVFLDVEMPEHAGYEIVDLLPEMNFDIVFCTAYDRYAIKAFEISAIDYLLKPVEVARLKQAAAKLEEKKKYKVNQKQIQQLNSSFKNTLRIMDKGERLLIPKSDIIAIEAQGAYSNIYTPTKTYTASKNMSQMEEALVQDTFFFRTQKSWMINLNCIEKVNKADKTVLLSRDILAKISRQKAKEFYSLLNL